MTIYKNTSKINNLLSNTSSKYSILAECNSVENELSQEAIQCNLA